jgi:hypothetical protein
MKVLSSFCVVLTATLILNNEMFLETVFKP